VSDVRDISGARGTANLELRIGVAASLVLLLIGFVSIVWVPYPIETVDVAGALQDPSGGHWLGTDQLGRDVVSLLMKGALASFVVSAIAVVIGALIGVPIGGAAAMWGGRAERLLLGGTDFIVLFPAFVLAVLAATLYGPSAVIVMAAVGIANIPTFARVTRDGLQSLRALDYVAAGTLAGMTRMEAIRRHVFPALGALLAVQAVVQLAFGIAAEASLSYVGLGMQAPATSLGLMLRDAQTYLLSKPVLALAPGAVVLLIVIALGLAAGGFRGLIDPRLQSIGADRGAA
jgi:peptide/nickel transport system permease protein